jgi:capsular exopolysaccharide synthesis family protein
MHGRIPSAATEFVPAAQSDTIDLRKVQDFFFRRWKVILAATAIVAALTFLVLLGVTPRYTSTAQVLLDPRKDKLFGTENVLPEFSLDSGNIDSQISIIRSINMLRRVVDKLKLTEDAEFGHAARSGLFTFLSSWFSSKAAVESAHPLNHEDIPADVLSAIGRLQAAADVQRVARTYVIAISVTSVDPGKAARLANAVADAYVVDQLDARYEGAKRASLWLAERMEGLREQVRQSEEAVATFRREHNLLTTTSETKLTINEQQLGELNAKLVAARAETAERRAKYEQVQQVQGRNGNVQAIPDVVRSTVISQLRTQQAEVARKTAELASRYNDNNPLVINARAELRDVERSISAEVARLISNLKNEYDVAKAREESLQKSLDQISGANGLDSDVGIKLRELERINAANKSLFESFLSRAKITQEQSTLQERETRLISPATMPSAPSFPKKTLVMSLALVVGTLIGIGGSVALDMLNAGYMAPREIEEKLGIPVLASVPLLREAERTIDGVSVDPASYTLRKPLSGYAESIRALRMGVQMADVDHPARVVMVTSTIPREGKTTISVSLAFSALKADQRVVLIDGDLRHPSATAFFQLEKKPGLVDFLTGSIPVEQTLVRIGGLTVIPAGSKTQNPPDLLGSARMKRLVEQLSEAFDYVVIDTPPVGPVIDARVALQLADKVIYVVLWRSTTRELVAQNLKELDPDRKLAGIVLSCVDQSKTSRYGPYSYYGGEYYKRYYQG